MSIVPLPIKYAKPPLRIFGFVFCRHVWKKYWMTIAEGTQVEQEKCARCLKDKEKWKGNL